MNQSQQTSDRGGAVSSRLSARRITIPAPARSHFRNWLRRRAKADPETPAHDFWQDTEELDERSRKVAAGVRREDRWSPMPPWDGSPRDLVRQFLTQSGGACDSAKAELMSALRDYQAETGKSTREARRFYLSSTTIIPRDRFRK